MIKLPHFELYKVLGYHSPYKLSKLITKRRADIEAEAGPIEVVTVGKIGDRYILTLKQIEVVVHLRDKSIFSRAQPKDALREVRSLYAKREKDSQTPIGKYASIQEYAKAHNDEIKYLISDVNGTLRLSHRLMHKDCLGAFDITIRALIDIIQESHKDHRIKGRLVRGSGPTKAYSPYLLTARQWIDLANNRYISEPVERIRALATITKAFKEAHEIIGSHKPATQTTNPKRKEKSVSKNITLSARPNVPSAYKRDLTLRAFSQRTHTPLDALITHRGEVRVSHRALASDGLDIFGCTHQAVDLSLKNRIKNGTIKGKVKEWRKPTHVPGKQTGRSTKHILLTESQWLAFSDARNAPLGALAMDKSRCAIKAAFNEARELVDEKLKDKAPITTTITDKPKKKAVASPKVTPTDFVKLSYVAYLLNTTEDVLRNKLNSEGSHFPLDISVPSVNGYITAQTAFTLICEDNFDIKRIWGDIHATSLAQAKAGGIKHVEYMRNKLKPLLASITRDLSRGVQVSAMDYIVNALMALGESQISALALADIFRYDIKARLKTK